MSDSQTLLTLAALLEAGFSLPAARQSLAEELASLELSAAAALEEVLALAEKHGGSVVWLLETLAEQHQQQQRLLAQAKLAEVTPRSTAKLVAILPLVCLGLAQLTGIKVLQAIAFIPATAISCALGIGLLLANAKVLGKMAGAAKDRVLAEAHGSRATTHFLLLLGAGVPASRLDFAQLPPKARRVALVAREQGFALTQVLRALVAQAQSDSAFAQAGEIDRLAIKMLVPLGLLVLPALVLLVVVPLAFALITN